MSFKAKIKQKIFTTWTVKKLSSLSFLVFQFKSFLGFQTRGLSQFRALALNKILKQLPNGLFTVGIVRQGDFSDAEVVRLQKWSLKNPDNHISLFLQPDIRTSKLVIGNNWIEKFDQAEIEERLTKVNALFKDEQYLKGVNYLVRYIRTKF